MKLKIDCSQPGLAPELTSLSDEEAADLQALQTALQTQESTRAAARQQVRDALAGFTGKQSPTAADAITALKTLIQHLGVDR